MEKTRFAEPSLEIARANLRTLFDAFIGATGFPIPLASELVADDRAFVYRFKRTGLNFSTYDKVVGRFSWLWPDSAAWPASVPRLVPELPSDKAIAKLNDRANQAAANNTPTLPGNAAWPTDIPAPGSTSKTNNGGRNG